MRSSPTSPSRSPSTSSGPAALAAAAALVTAVAAPGCGEDCGPGGAPAAGFTVTGGDLAVAYGELSGLLGNDCPAPDAPAGIVSLSIEGRTADGTGFLTLCIPRPDLLLDGPRALGAPRTSADVWIEDLNALAGGCTYRFDDAAAPLASITATGVCQNATDPAGWALEVEGTVGMNRTCGATTEPVTVTLSGRVAVGYRTE